MQQHLTKQQIAIVSGKVQGKTQAEIGREVYPNQTPAAAAVSVSRQLRKANIQDELRAALERQGISIDRAVKPIADGLTATRIAARGVNASGDMRRVPDHAIRLKAASMALGLLVPRLATGTVSIQFNELVQQQRELYQLDMS